MAKKHSKIQPKEMSERGIWLVERHMGSQSINPNMGKNVAMEVGGNDTAVPVGSKCPVCKFKVRGLNHCSGDHHRKRVPKCGR